MTREQLAEAIMKLLSENEISINDAMQALIAHTITLAIVSCVQAGHAPEAARPKLHGYIDLLFDEGLKAVVEAGKP